MSAPVKLHRERLAQAAFGMTRQEAHDLGVCIRCRRPPMFQTNDDRKEYRISGLCPKCYDRIAEAAEGAQP